MRSQTWDCLRLEPKPQQPFRRALLPSTFSSCAVRLWFQRTWKNLKNYQNFLFHTRHKDYLNLQVNSQLGTHLWMHAAHMYTRLCLRIFHMHTWNTNFKNKVKHNKKRSSPIFSTPCLWQPPTYSLYLWAFQILFSFLDSSNKGHHPVFVFVWFISLSIKPPGSFMLSKGKIYLFFYGWKIFHLVCTYTHKYVCVYVCTL